MKNLLSLMWVNAIVALGAVVRNDAVTIESLNESLLDLNGQVEGIQAMADGENRDLTETEVARVNEIFNQFKAIESDIDRRERIAAQKAKLEASAGRIVTPSAKVYQQPKARDVGKNGFESFGHFASAVRQAAHPAARNIDPRLIVNAPGATTTSTEGTGADGGYSVPGDYRTEIQKLVFGDDALISMTDGLTTSSNSMSFPTDEATPWGSSGVQASWEGETDQIAQSKINLKEMQVRLNKLASLVPVTEELADDSSALNSYLNAKVPEVLTYKINDALFNGTGAGMPLGILNAAALVEVAKEGSQVADTIVFDNIIKMWSRMRAMDRKTAVWFINQDIEPQLMTMSFEGTSSSVPAYMPANGLSGQPYGTLMGRPVIPIENAQTLGDKGDIMFVNMKRYMTAQKTSGMRSDTSMHLWFDYDVLAFKFTIRVAGQPWLSAPVTPANGASTYSPFVTLAERA